MERIGRYELGELLGEGGAGRVHDATLVGPGGFRMPVALKLLHEGGEALRREARIGGLLRHRHLVDVYEVGEVDGQWFCALERCDDALSRHVPLPPRAVVEVGLAVCDALQYAHDELGLVHLDLKPSNLLVRDGVVKVADLGIARAEGFADDGRVHGSPAYMAPEQAAGRLVDTRTDLYALGVTLVELASGVRPGASAPETLASWLTGEVATHERSEATAAPEVPEWLVPAVLPCLAPSPEGRWPDPAALAEALRALEVDGPGLREVLGVADPAPGGASGTNLDQRASLVGRADEVAHLLGLLDRPGVILVKGPAGIGKSHLSAAVAAAWHDGGRGDAWYVDLSDVRHRDTLVGAVGQTLGVQPKGAHPADEVGDALALRGPTLLLLDGVDHLTDHASIVGAWSEGAPELRVVLTSRRALELPSIRGVDVGPLDEDAARKLLVARAARRGVELTDDDVLAELAERLDGLPLALELAAGRLGVLSVSEVLERLGLSLLRSGTGGRHDTLGAALEGSWDQLDADARAASTQLSVFDGGFAIAAAEAVLDLGDASVLDALDRLERASMITTSGRGRFTLLYSVREWSRERLVEPERTEVRHGAWFARFGSQAFVDALAGPDGGLYATEIRPEMANLRAAARRASMRRDEAVLRPALRALEAAAGRPPSSVVAAVGEDLDWLSPGGRAHVLRAAAHLEVLAMDLDRADALLARAEPLARQAEDGAQRCRVFLMWARVAYYARRPEVAVERFEQAFSVALSAGYVVGCAAAALGLGHVAFVRGDHDAALAHLARATELNRQAGEHRGLVSAQSGVGRVLQGLGRVEEAARCFEAALQDQRALGRAHEAAPTLAGLGLAYAHLGRFDDASRCHEQALALCRRSGDRQGEAMSLLNLAAVASDRVGAEGEALERATAAADAATRIGDVDTEATAHALLGDLARRRGDLSEARHHLDAAGRLAGAAGSAQVSVYLAHLADAEGTPQAAQGYLEESLELARSAGDDGHVALVLAELAVRADDERALRLTEEAVDRIGALEVPGTRAEVLLARACVLARCGRRDEAASLAAEAQAEAPPDDRGVQLALERLASVLPPGSPRGR